MVPSAPVKKGRKAAKPKVVETKVRALICQTWNTMGLFDSRLECQATTSSGRKQGQGAAQADDEGDDDDDDPASADEKGKAKAQGRKGTAVTVVSISKLLLSSVPRELITALMS